MEGQYSYATILSVSQGFHSVPQLLTVLPFPTPGQDGADACNQYKSCDKCIANGIGCVWCPDPPVSLCIPSRCMPCACILRPFFLVPLPLSLPLSLPLFRPLSLLRHLLQPFSGPRCTSSHRANCSSELEDPVAQPPHILREVLV